MTAASPHVGGYDLGLFGVVSGMWDSTLWRLGDFSGDSQCEFDFSPPPGWVPPAWLKRGQLLEVVGMSGREWYGYVTEIDPGDDTWHIAGQGLAAQAVNYDTLDATIPTAVTNAISRGLPWTTGGTVTGTLTNGGASPYITLADLLAADSQAGGYRWQVDSQGAWSYVQDPTTPRWIASPGLGLLPVSDDQYVTHLAGRYVSAPTSGDPTAWAYTPYQTPAGSTGSLGRVEAIIDLTPQGYMTATAAAAYITARLPLVTGRMGWVDGFSLSYGQVWAAGSGLASPMDIRAGHMFRIPDVIDDQSQAGTTAGSSFVLGEVKRYHDDHHVEVTPVGFAPRDFEGALAAAQAPDAAA